MKQKTLLVLGLGALMTLASCGTAGEAGSGVYTYRSYVSGTPKNWNPHTWEDSGASEITGYSEIGFVDYSYDPDVEGGYKVVYEMATGISNVTKDPTVVNDDFKDKWGITDDDESRVWKINLNPNAKFASGTVINAQTYVDSMELLLNSEYKNYRANNYYSGDTSLVHAFNYYNAGARSLTNFLSIPEWGVTVEDAVYVDIASSPIFDEAFGSTYAKVKATAGYAAYFTTPDKVNVLEKYVDPVELTDSILTELASIPLWSALGVGDQASDYVKLYFCSSYVSYDDIDFSDVGLLALDDYTLVYITEYDVSEFNFEVACSSLWLVNPTLYKSLTTTGSNGLKTSSYGTAAAGVAGYDSFGPYKLTSFEEDKQYKFERNENWYGWTDGKHEGQYQTTNIVVDVYKEHSSALLAFEKGDLDGISLEQADLAKYGYSDYLRHVPETYTMRLVFDSNLDDLKALEASAGNGKNKQILSLYDFRKAISLSIDRTRFNAEGTAGNQASYSLLNSLYFYDVENDPSSVYRNTDEAKKAIVDLYGMEYGEGKTYKTLDEAYKAVTGLDVPEAKKLFTSAYNDAVEAGIYTDGQEIEFEIGYYDATMTSSTTQTKLLNEFVATATEGTPLEGKITFKGKSFSGDPDRYDAIGSGQVEIANCAWGGAAFYPFNSIRVYCDPSYTDINEARSWDPTSETLDITYDWDGKGEETTKTKTFQAWSLAIGSSSGEYYTADINLKLHVLSKLENAILDKYLFAVVGSYAAVSLDSMKIKFPTDTYNMFYGFGGIRYMTYNYDDAAWSSFVASQGGTLNYA